MVGDVIEMLAWYSEPVNTAFYETLLGSKVADAPEDVVAFLVNASFEATRAKIKRAKHIDK